MINSDLDIKEKFAEMCKLIFINGKGEFVFPIDNLIHDDDYSDFLNHSDWNTLESKMENLILLVNNDHSILEKDVETEIWEMI
jgi:hypothetical protein